MLPIVRTQELKSPYSGRSFVGNIVLDKKGRECTMMIDGLHLMNKNGTISKRLSKEW